MLPTELPGATLLVHVRDFRRFSRHEPLGTLSLPLGTVDLQHVLELWLPLGPPGCAEVRPLTSRPRPGPGRRAGRDAEAPSRGPQAEQTGELCFSICFVPSSGRLTVVVLEARGLSPGLAGKRHARPSVWTEGPSWMLTPGSWSRPSRRPEPYVKVQLMLNQRKWKKRRTSAGGATATPYFNQAFTFHVPLSQLQVGCPEEGAGGSSLGARLTAVSVSPHRTSACLPQSVDLVLAVWARGPRFRAEPVGEVVLGTRASGQPLQHWADMLAHARRPIARWHRLRPPSEVGQALAREPRPHPPLLGS